MAKAVILIDGAYLEMLLIKEHDRAQVDYHKLALGLVKKVSRFVGQPVHLMRTYYYHALPWAPADPTEEERERVYKKQGFFHRLEYLPRFEVKLGRTQRTISEDGTVFFEQRGVDVQLVADFVNLAARGMVEHLVLVAPDSDYVPVVKMVKDLGVIVHLVHGGNLSSNAEMRKECDERIELDPDFVYDVRRSGNVRQPNQPSENDFKDYNY